MVEGLAEVLEAGDIVVDGGNSHFPSTVVLGDRLAERGIHMIDVGTSGGVWGLEGGYSMMVGGEDEAVALLRPALEALAPASNRGWGHVGPRGAGHYVKMIHNGIEYGVMQAYAEGFHILHDSEYALDLHQTAEIWRHGSVIRSWLLDLIARALGEDVELSALAAYVPDSGEGRWTVREAIDRDVPRAGHHAGAAGAAALAGRGQLRRQAALGDAPPIRWARHEEEGRVGSCPTLARTRCRSRSPITSS